MHQCMVTKCLNKHKKVVICKICGIHTNWTDWKHNIFHSYSFKASYAQKEKVSTVFENSCGVTKENTLCRDAKGCCEFSMS